MMRTERAWRWVETDPFGRLIYCAEDVWRTKVQQRPEIGPNEQAVRTAVRFPDAIYYDQRSSAVRQAQGSSASIMHFVGAGSVRVPEGLLPALVSVVVKLLEAPTAGGEVGYVQTA